MTDTYQDIKAYQLMQKARTALILHKGWQGSFYAPLVMRLPFVENYKVPTMATDGKYIYYNPQYACELSEDERIGVIVHETNHCASLHHLRMGFRPLIHWNEACDYPTNENVLKAGFTLPKGLLINPEFYGMSAEDVYNVLYPPIPPAKPEPEDDQEDASEPAQEDNAGKPSQEGTSEPSDDPGQKDASDDPSEPSEAGKPGSDNPGQSETDGGSTGDDEPEDAGDGGTEPGSSGKQSPANAQGETPSGQASDDQEPSEQGTSGVPGQGTSEPMEQELGCGGILPAWKPEPGSDEPDTASSEQWEQAVREATSLAKAKGWGSHMPDAIREILTEIEMGKHDWKDQLRQFTDNRRAVKETWKRPNRRFATSSFAMPGSEKDGLDHALWMIDTSGSMDSHWLACIRGEIQEALDAGFIDKITVVCIDTTIKAVFEYDTGESIDFEPVGRGGTEFAPAFDWIRKQDAEFSCCIYLTDLDCSNFGTAPDCPVLWAVYGRYWSKPVPFGEVIRLSE